MRNLWATVFATWALFAVLAVLAWTRPQPATTPANHPGSRCRHRQERQEPSRRRAGRRLDVARDDANLARPGGMIAAADSRVCRWPGSSRALPASSRSLCSRSLSRSVSRSAPGCSAASAARCCSAGTRRSCGPPSRWSSCTGRALAVDPVMRFGFRRSARARRRTVAAPARRRRHRHRMAHARPCGLFPCASPDRPAPLAPDALRQLRRLRDRPLPRPQRRHRPHRDDAA